MARNQTFTRSLNDLGLAAWFGGSLMGAVGLNQSAARRSSTDQTAAVARAGWDGWTPVNLGAIGAHLIGASALAIGNKGRVAGQRGVARTSFVKTALTAVALGTTAYSRILGKRVGNGLEPAVSGTEPASGTSGDTAAAQRQLDILQWVIPAVTAGMIICDAALGEQQRPTNVAAGILAKLTGGGSGSSS